MLWAKELRKAGILQSFMDEDMAIFNADQALAYAAEVKREIEDVQREIASRKAKSASPDQSVLDGRLSRMHITADKNENAALITPQSKQKTKTRRCTTPKADEEIATTSTAKQTENILVSNVSSRSLSPVLVKRENMALFGDMFPENGCEGQRSFKWQHFLDAMNDAGFSISQASGSAVTFRLGSTDKNDDANTSDDFGSIVFHRPHPLPVIHPIMLRSMGKRLSKWFGWRREVFEEK